MIVNPKKLGLEKKGEIDLKQYAHNDASPEPAYGILRDGLLASRSDRRKLDAIADYRQVVVAVIDTKTDKV